MVISSLVVETMLDYTQQVADELASRQGIEVHGIDGYKIIITIEAPTVDESHAIANAIVPVVGVIGVDLIYLNFEDDPTIYPNGV
ncbi:MAG: chaperone NapD [Eggerthellaceae bacterium]|nr:chaperone NapD [Eggerthellaceae bacterium]